MEAVAASTPVMPVNISGKWMLPRITDSTKICRICPRGIRTNGRSTAATAVNRRNIMKIGENSRRPYLATAKLKPQITITARAAAMSRGVTGGCSCSRLGFQLFPEALQLQPALLGGGQVGLQPAELFGRLLEAGGVAGEEAGVGQTVGRGLDPGRQLVDLLGQLFQFALLLITELAAAG